VHAASSQARKHDHGPRAGLAVRPRDAAGRKHHPVHAQIGMPFLGAEQTTRLHPVDVDRLTRELQPIGGQSPDLRRTVYTVATMTTSEGPPPPPGASPLPEALRL